MGGTTWQGELTQMVRLLSGAGIAQVCARCSLGQKLMNRCGPEKKDAEEHEKIGRHLKPEEGEVPSREAQRWKIQGERGE